jgi:hypothetical protein
MSPNVTYGLLGEFLALVVRTYPATIYHTCCPSYVYLNYTVVLEIYSLKHQPGLRRALHRWPIEVREEIKRSRGVRI